MLLLCSILMFGFFVFTHRWGGKGVGSQGDGCAQFVCKSYKDQQQVSAIVTQQLKMVSIPLTVQAATSKC